MATYAATLYSLISQLNRIEKCYQYSIKQFLALFKGVVSGASLTTELSMRLSTLTKKLDQTVINDITPRLAVQHRLLLAFEMAVAQRRVYIKHCCS